MNMNIISTLNAAKQMARNANEAYSATPMGTLGNLNFKQNGGSPARRHPGIFERIGTSLVALKSALFSTSEQRAQMRQAGADLRAMKRCGHLFGKLTADMTQDKNLASVAVTLGRMCASVPQSEGARATLGPRLEKSLSHVTDQDRADILAGVRAMQQANASGTGGVALSNGGMIILDHIARTLSKTGGADSSDAAATAGTAPAVHSKAANGGMVDLPEVKLTQAEEASHQAPAKLSPLNLSEPAASKTPPPIPPRPPGYLASPRVKPAGPQPAIPPRPGSHASTPASKAVDAKASDGAVLVDGKPVPKRKPRVADVVTQIAVAVLKEQDLVKKIADAVLKEREMASKSPGRGAPSASFAPAPVRVK